MELVLITLLIIAVLAFIAYPLRTGGGTSRELSRGGFMPQSESSVARDDWRSPLPPAREENSHPPHAPETLIAQRDSTYAAIRDLDFDFQLGKLSPRDYQVLRERYKARAALTLQQIDALSGDGADAQIEEEVARLRGAGLRCANCGTPHRAGSKYCSQCGNKLD